MKKVIRLTESQLTNIIEKIVKEATDSTQGKKCFNQKTFDDLKRKTGHVATKKIQSGDVWSKIQQMTDDKGEFILKHNKSCDVKNPKIGEIIMYSTLPTR